MLPLWSIYVACGGASDDDDREVPKPKARSYIEAAIYDCKFDSSWKQKYSCIQLVKGTSYSFLCTVCSKKLS